MDRPPLTVALSSVLTAAMENTDRPGLLATVRSSEPEPGEEAAGTVIPLPRRAPQDENPTPAA